MVYRVRRDLFSNVGKCREQRLTNFQAMLIRVNQLMVTATDESTLMQALCDIIVQKGRYQLAFIAVPDDQGRFQYLASAGEHGYLLDLHISTDPTIPEGRGSMGNGWREDQTVYNQFLQNIPDMWLWKERAERFGIHSSASLPIHRGGKKWGMLSIYHAQENIFDEDMRSLIETLAIDITNGLDRIDLVNAERQLVEVQRHFIDRTSVGMAMIQDIEMVMVNQRLVSMLGYTNVSELIGQPVTLIYPQYQTDKESGRLFSQLQHKGYGDESGLSFACRDGRQIKVELSISLLHERSDEAHDLSIWTVQDVTDNYVLQQQLEHAALHDALTALPNRRALDQKLHHTIVQAKQAHTSFLLGMIDLDNFKYVNDTLGHEAGDQLLIAFTQRLSRHLRSGDFLARWGGDEFVLLLHHIPPTFSDQDLEDRLASIHRVVETPFEMGLSRGIDIEMSMGLAHYPQHGEEGDQLLRTADIAMYQMKIHSWSRNRWWQLGISDEVSSDFPRARLQFPTQLLVDQFFEQIRQEEYPLSIINSLSKAEADQYRDNAIKHIDYLFHSSDSLDKIREHARRVGKINALMGVNGQLLSQATDFLSQMITKFTARHLLNSDYEMIAALQHRLQIDLQIQLQVQEQVMTHYLNIFSPHLSTPQSEDLTALSHLPGIIGVLRFKLHPQEGFIVEEAVGHRGREIAVLLTVPAIKAIPNSIDPKGRSLLAESWFSASVVSTPSYLNDLRFEVWHDAFRKLGIHSLLMVPLLDSNLNTMAVIGLYGAFAHQFESPWMKAFAQGVQLFGQARWGQNQKVELMPSRDEAGAYRAQLFNDGLLIYMQPIVHLQTGEILKYELLARMQTGSGKILSPATFLPLLGLAEIDRLFQLGLERGIQVLLQWGHLAEHAGISINLSPSTLYNQEIIPWIQQTLARYQFPPERIYLELLETQGFDLDSLVEPLMKLVDMGIHLAMDDFGAGDSNFLRLVVHPFHLVKFDRGLWATLDEHPLSTLKLLGSLIEIGNDFGWEIVVEGIETLEMAEAVSLLGAEYGQGYYFARPMPMDQVLDWQADFAYSIVSGSIHTKLGALAYLVKKMRANRKQISSEAECPITHFFLQQGWGNSEGMVLHHRIHQGEDDPSLYKRLLDWVEDKLINVE